MNVVEMPIAELAPAPYNPRKALKAGDPEYQKLRRSIEEFGLVDPVIWNSRTKRVVGGHQRLTVLRDLGHTTAPAVLVDLDEGREKALNVACARRRHPRRPRRAYRRLRQLPPVSGRLAEVSLPVVGMTAALIVFFMRFADWIEERTTERARSAIRLLTQLAPQTARVIRDGVEQEVPAAEVAVGEVVAVRPGERIPADGEVVTGSAAVDQSSLTGESVPVDVAPGSRVLASTLVQGGYLEVRALRTGADTTFAKVVRLVEEAESQKAPVQRFADRFTAYTCRS